MNEERDDDLRQHFAKLRAHEETDAPRFREVLSAASAHDDAARSHRIPRPGTALGWFSVVAAVLLVWFMALSPPAPRVLSVPTPYAALDPWALPTDGLLEIPGRELLRTLPTFASAELVLPWTKGVTQQTN